MRRKNRCARTAGAVLSASLLAGLILFPRATGAEVWRLVRGPSSVEFAVSHLLFTKVTGRFSHFTASIDCPGDNFTDAKVEATIDVTSVYTGHADRDRQLLTEAFFAAERYPEMRFESRSVVRTGPETYRLVGDLTIRGVTREVALEAVYRGERRTARGRRRDLRATGSINRSDYGLSWNDTWADRALVAEKVEITLEIALVEVPG